MMRALVLALCLGATSPALAQSSGWGNLDGLLMGSLLPPQASLEGAYWLPDSGDPAQARSALGIAYYTVPNGGNSFNIVSGYFFRSGGGWSFSHRVQGLFGTTPRDVAFFEDRIEVTTTMPNPGDPRCCPTGEGRWSVDRATGTVARLR